MSQKSEQPPKAEGASVPNAHKHIDYSVRFFARHFSCAFERRRTHFWTLFEFLRSPSRIFLSFSRRKQARCRDGVLLPRARWWRLKRGTRFFFCESYDARTGGENVHRARNRNERRRRRKKKEEGRRKRPRFFFFFLELSYTHKKKCLLTLSLSVVCI